MADVIEEREDGSRWLRLGDGDRSRIHRFRIDGERLYKEGLERGATATLYLFPHGAKTRVFSLVNHRSRHKIFEIIDQRICEALFGTDVPGIYDVRIERLDHDPGATG